MLWPCVANSSVTTAIDRLRVRSSATASVIVNDVHEPHVPRPTIAKSTASRALLDVLRSSTPVLADLRAGLDAQDVGARVAEPLLPVAGDQRHDRQAPSVRSPMRRPLTELPSVNAGATSRARRAVRSVVGS